MCAYNNGNQMGPIAQTLSQRFTFYSILHFMSNKLNVASCCDVVQNHYPILAVSYQLTIINNLTKINTQI